MNRLLVISSVVFWILKFLVWTVAIKYSHAFVLNNLLFYELLLSAIIGVVTFSTTGEQKETFESAHIYKITRVLSFGLVAVPVIFICYLVILATVN